MKIKSGRKTCAIISKVNKDAEGLFIISKMLGFKCMIIMKSENGNWFSLNFAGKRYEVEKEFSSTNKN